MVGQRARPRHRVTSAAMSAVRSLAPTPLGVAAVREVLAAAFVDDPMLQWIFPDAVQHTPATAAWLGVFVEAYAAAAVTDVIAADGLATAGVALWRCTTEPLPFSPAPSVGGLMAAFLGVERATQLGEGLGAFAANKPAPPFHYLQFLAVHPSRQGHGLGRQLVLHGQQRAAEAGVGVYLESTNPRNLPFYRSCGFREIGRFELLPAGPPAFRLWWQE
jgi:ribosomal protein S18 acetylase RimI-like enzyme